MYQLLYIENTKTKARIEGYYTVDALILACAVMNDNAGYVKYEPVGVKEGMPYTPATPALTLVINQHISKIVLANRGKKV